MAKNLDDATVEVERIADAIMAAEYMLVCAGPNFDDASSNPFDSEFCVSTLISKPNKFMGFWGEFYNEYLDKVPHEGYNVISKFRDKLFSADDIRRRNKKAKSDAPGEEDQFLRFMVYTGHIGNSFQKSGIPDQEMMEVCGNITQWQCGMNPICCARVFGIERGFKFYIDPLTRDALPIKYVPSKQLTPSIGGGSARKTNRSGGSQNAFSSLVDSEEEELAFRKSVERGEGLAFAKGVTPEDKARRLQRLRDHARVVRLSRQIQLLDDRFPDLFTGFVSNVGDTLETYTFDGLAHSSTMSGMGARGMFGGGGGGFGGSNPSSHQDSSSATTGGSGDAKKGEGGGGEKKGASSKDQPPAKKVPCADPMRVSHLLAHVNAIDRKMYASSHRGTFAAIEAEKWRADRDAAFVALTKSPMAMESHSVSSRREKILRYNVSLVVVSEGHEGEGTGAGRYHHSPSYSSRDEDVGCGGTRAFVLPQALREKLLKPYVSGSAEEERAVDELVATEMKDWSQSTNGWYYFSNVKLTRTQQEPVNNSYSDFVQIEVPREDGGYRLPLKGTISLVCETVMLAEGEHVPSTHTKMMASAAAAGVGNQQDVQPNPYVYTNNVWQIVGTVDTTRATASLSSMGAAGSGVVGTGGTNKSSSLSDEKERQRDAFEYVLEGRRGHVLHIGSLKSSPQTITYFHLEVPHDDWPVTPTPGIPSRLVRPLRDTTSNSSYSHRSIYDTATSGDGGLSPRGTAEGRGGWGGGGAFAADGSDINEEPLEPTLNHILCTSCREIARPYVLMTRSSTAGSTNGPATSAPVQPPKKDDGFATAVMNQRNKAFKAWEKSIVDALKQDQNKSIVLIEVGADRKMDPARAYSEKTFKLLKSAKCTFVRLSGFNLDTKTAKASSGGGGGGGSSTENSNQISIICNPIMGLQSIERAVNERIKKITK